jgi:hypothetical protein
VIEVTLSPVLIEEHLAALLVGAWRAAPDTAHRAWNLDGVKTLLRAYATTMELMTSVQNPCREDESSYTRTINSALFIPHLSGIGESFHGW